MFAHRINRLIATLMAAALCVTAVACGGSSAHSPSGSPASAKDATVLGSDRDNDNDHNDDDGRVFGYGHAASAADERSSARLIASYYAAAAAQDGAKACKLLVPLLSESLVGELGGSPGLAGKTCAVVLSKLFARRHRELSAKRSAVRLMTVRIEGEKGLVVLEFPEIPEVRQIGIRRVNGVWKLRELFDGIIE